MHCHCLFSQGWFVFVLHSFRPRDSCGCNWLQNWATALLHSREASKEACAPLGAPETDLGGKKWIRTCVSVHFIMKHCDNWCYHDSQQWLLTLASSQDPPAGGRVSSPGGREGRPPLHHHCPSGSSALVWNRSCLGNWIDKFSILALANPHKLAVA